MYLFVDTSTNLKLGVVSTSFEFIEIVELEKPATSNFHFEIDQLLRKHNLDILNMKGVLTISGPGSYTGMRLSHGFAQVIALNHIPYFSLYHYEIPSLVNISKGLYITDAFKGEFFVYQWGVESLQKIVEYKDIAQFMNGEETVYYSSLQKFHDYVHSKKLINTFDLLKENSKQIFQHLVFHQIKKEINYFRPAEVEFKTSEK